MGWKLESERVLNISVWYHVKPLQKKMVVEGEALQQFPLHLFPSRLSIVIHSLVQNSINMSAEEQNAGSHQLCIIYFVKMFLRACVC